MQPVNINEGLKTLTSGLDNMTSTADEKDTHLDARQAADMASDSWLAKAIRPMLAIYYSALYGAGLIMGIIASDGDPLAIAALIGTTGAIVTAIIGFYFTSRRAEKILAKKLESESKILTKKLEATIEVEKIRAESEADERDMIMDQESKEHRAELRAKRKANRRPLFGRNKNKEEDKAR